MTQKVSPLVEVLQNPQITWIVAPNKAKLGEVQGQIRDLEHTKKRKGIFGFESVKEDADAEAKELKKEECHLKMALAGYPQQLDYTFLSRTRGEKDWPIFMVLDLKTNQFQISSGDWWWDAPGWNLRRYIQPELPRLIVEQYRQTVLMLHEKVKRDEVLTLSAEFHGVVPNQARLEIAKAQRSRLFDQLLVIAEAPEWQLRKIVVADGDPLVVGWVEKTGQMFLVTMFDPTPFEEYIAHEYSWTIKK